MPSMRTIEDLVTINHRSGRILVYSPPFVRTGLRASIYDGDSLSLHARLLAEHFNSKLLDGFHRASKNLELSEAIRLDRSVSAVIIHLWKADAYGPPLREVAADLLAIRRDFPSIPIVAFGFLATSAEDELIAHGAVDAVVSHDRLQLQQGLDIDALMLVQDLAKVIRRHLHEFMPIRRLPIEELPKHVGSVFSVIGSHGCHSKCTFCSYNSDLGPGWIGRDMSDVAADIIFIAKHTGHINFAFSDNDFGGTAESCRERARVLRRELTRAGLAEQIRITINVRSETLDQSIIEDLRAAGVRAMLIGVESFNSATLRRIYGKRCDYNHLNKITQAADDAGITVIASYILWHPWQSIESLRMELEHIDLFGAHRVPQFLAESRLRIIPGTAIEKRIASEGFMISDRFHRDFTFACTQTSRLYERLRRWHESEVVPFLIRVSDDTPQASQALAKLKIREISWLRSMLNVLETNRTVA